MNNNNPNPAADAPVPPSGTEQAADQANKLQQPPPAESSTLDTVSNVVEGVVDATDVVGGILSIFDI